jgi:hypothetical protein
MEMTELRQSARRSYELGRVRLGARVGVAALLVGGAVIGLGRPVAMSIALSASVGALVWLFAFRGGAAGRAVWPALVAGSAAMFFPVALGTAGCRMFGEQCMRFCVPMCIAGGAAMGAILALSARHEENDPREFLIAGAVIAALTASMGCSLAGVLGIAGMAFGTVAAGAPIWLAARAAR